MSTELIQTLFDRIDHRDWSALPDLFDPEVVYERPGYEPFRGIDRLLRFYKQERIIGSGTHQLAGLVADDGQGACWGRFVGVSRSGEPIDEAFADFYSFKDGRIGTRRSFFFRPAI